MENVFSESSLGIQMPEGVPGSKLHAIPYANNHPIHCAAQHSVITMTERLT
jgi:hypothetical protein